MAVKFQFEQLFPFQTDDGLSIHRRERKDGKRKDDDPFFATDQIAHGELLPSVRQREGGILSQRHIFLTEIEALEPEPDVLGGELLQAVQLGAKNRGQFLR